MDINRSLRSKLHGFYKVKYKEMERAINIVIQHPHLLDDVVRSDPRLKGRREAFQELELETVEFYQTQAILDRALTVVFSDEQAKVFLEAHKSHFDSLDFRLPFECTFLQFLAPVTVDIGAGPDNLIGLVMMQKKYTHEEWRDSYARMERHRSEWDSRLQTVPLFKPNAFINNVVALFSDMNVRMLTWLSDDMNETFQTSADTSIMAGWRAIRNLAIACIGYINCENIYLHQEGVVPDKVNRKREREGKKILEPYYVCRIRGVQYDSNGEPTGEGTHHGFRYDVRGHFRRLDSGKTTWVRPHQRGLQHELYIPKTYVIEKGAKQLPATAAELGTTSSGASFQEATISSRYVTR